MSTPRATTGACAEHGCGHRAQAHVISPSGEWCSVDGCGCDGFVTAGGQQPGAPPRGTAVIDAGYLAHQRDWSAATFGPGFRLGVLDHLAKELEEVRAGKWTVPDPTSCTAIVLDDGHITSVEVLREPTPEWVSQPGEVVREGLITWVRQDSTWVAAEPHDLFASDQRIWHDVQRGVAVRLVPDATP